MPGSEPNKKKFTLIKNAEFYTKADNPSTRKEQGSSSSDNSSRFIFAGVKHSGSLILIGSDGSFSTKHSANTKFTNVARLLFDAWMGDKGPEFLKFLKENQLSLGLELVCPHFLGDHVEIPKNAYLAVTCVSDLKAGAYYSLPELVKFCEEYGLPCGEYYFFKTGKEIPDLKTFKMKMDMEKLKNTLEFKEKLKELTETSGGVVFPGNIPHEEVQGDLAEGAVAWEFECKSDYDPIGDLKASLKVDEGMLEPALNRLKEEGVWLSKIYCENKHSDDYPTNGRAKDEFWGAIEKRLAEKGVNGRCPDKMGTLLDKEIEIQANGKQYKLASSEGFVELLKELDDTESEKLKAELAKLSKKTELNLKQGFYHLGELFKSLKGKKIPPYLIEYLAEPFKAAKEGESHEIDKNCISIKVYKIGKDVGQEEQDSFHIHVKLKNDLDALEKGVKIGRGCVFTLSQSLPETNLSATTTKRLEDSKKITQIGSALKLKVLPYLILRGEREAWYFVEKFLRKRGLANIIYKKARDKFLKEIKTNLKPSFAKDYELFFASFRDELSKINESFAEGTVDLVNEIVAKYDQLSKNDEKKLEELFSGARGNAIHLFDYMVSKRFDTKKGDGEPNKLSSDEKVVKKIDKSDGFVLEGYFLEKASKLADSIKNGDIDLADLERGVKNKFYGVQKPPENVVAALVYYEENKKNKRKNEQYEAIPVLDALYYRAGLEHKELTDIKKMKKDDPSCILKDSASVSDECFKEGIKSLLKNEIKIVLVFNDIQKDMDEKQKKKILEKLNLGDKGNGITLLHKKSDEFNIKHLCFPEEASSSSKPQTPALSGSRLFVPVPASSQTEDNNSRNDAYGYGRKSS